MNNTYNKMFLQAKDNYTKLGISKDEINSYIYIVQQKII